MPSILSSCASQSLGTSRADGQHDSGVQFLAGGNVTLLDVLERSVVEQHFHATETPGADRDEVSVWELVGILVGTFRGRFELCVAVKRHVAKFSLTSRPITLCAVVVKEYLRSVRIFIR